MQIVVILCCLVYAGFGWNIFDEVEEVATEIRQYNAKLTPGSIPMLTVSMNMDKNKYLSRLLASIDYPVKIVCIQIGNSDESIVKSVVHDIQVFRMKNPLINIQLTTLPYNPGSAKGFNFGLRNMLYSPSKPAWVLVVNNDIAFYPGVLKNLAEQVNKQLVFDHKFGIGFTSLCCGGEWSAVVFTRRMVEVVGFMDENFYPAYYEDDDYGIRVSLSSFKAVKFQDTPMLHGQIDGSKDYLSGLFSNLYMTKKLSRGEIAWKQAQELGQVLSKAYIEKKWNIKMPGFKDKIKAVDCKTVAGINGNCVVGYRSPHGDNTKTLRDWSLNEQEFNNLLAIANPK